MKIISFTKYGPPEYLKLIEVEKPAPNENEVLIRVHAASINSWDNELLYGTPFANRTTYGLLKPKLNSLGGDIAGEVVSTGKNVTQFSPGDEVLGDLTSCGWSGFAEYVCATENSLALKPQSMSFEQAAALPQAGAMALQAIRQIGQIEESQEVLINGAGGGTGTFAIQMVKSNGAIVTGVDSTEKLDGMRSLNVDHVIDYKHEDFTENGLKYDLIIDNIATRSILRIKNSLKPNGTYIVIGGKMRHIMGTIFLGPLISKTGQKMKLMLHKPNTEDLTYLGELFETGKITPVIDRTFKLGEVPEAFQYFGDGHAVGKVVITM